MNAAQVLDKVQHGRRIGRFAQAPGGLEGSARFSKLVAQFRVSVLPVHITGLWPLLVVAESQVYHGELW